MQHHMLNYIRHLTYATFFYCMHKAKYCAHYLLLCISVLLSLFCHAQLKPTSSYRHFTTAEGLPSTQVQGLFEDSRGYIWAITDRGASVYDGYNFKTYTTKNGLPTNSLLLINEDNAGRMWFMCNNGAYCYLQNDSIKTYSGNSKITALLKDKLPGPFFFDDKDTMWVTTFSGIQLFKCFGDSVQEFIPETKQNNPATYYLREVGDKLVNLQVGEIGSENKIITSDKISYLLSVAGDCKLACSVKVEENQWALSGPGGFVVFDETGNLQAHFNASPYVFSSMDHDRSGHLWLTNSNGAYRINNYNQNPDSAEVFFEGQFITALLQDRNGNYWLGDRDNGIYFVPSIEMKLFQSADEGKARKIVSLKIYDNQIYYCDASGKIFTLINDAAIEVMKVDLPSGVTLDFVQTNKTEFVVGNKPHVYNTKNNSIKSLNLESVIRKSVNLSNGRVAFCLADGLAFMDSQQQWQAVDKATFKERSNCLHEDENKVLWIGTNNGLYRYENGIFIACDSLNKLKPRIVDIEKWHGKPTAWDDYMVLATRNMGVIFYKNENDFVVVNEQDGLLSDITDCVEADSWGALWIGQSGGIQQMKVLSIEEKKFEFLRVNYEKGLPSNEVNDLLCFKSTMYVATNNGLALIGVDDTSLKASTSPVKIESLSNGALPIVLSDSLVLQHNQNDLQFHFAALNYRTGNNTLYRYRLIGLHNEWLQTTNRSAEYWKLNAGTFTFEVCAMNEDGAWSEPTQISFTILQHFSKTLWFRTLVLMLLLGAIALAFYIFYRNKRQKLESKAKMLELRQQALNANMNPHFIFNSLSSIQLFINTNRTREANDYLADFSKLIRMNLETNLHNMVSLEDELERLELYLKLEKLRFGEQLNYAIGIEQNINTYDLQIPPMLLQPYAENALLHGILPSHEPGHINIKVFQSEANYTVQITDNGIGINKSKATKDKKHTSLALKMNEERMAILSNQTGQAFSVSISDLSDVEISKHGTLVSIELPINT